MCLIEDVSLGFAAIEVVAFNASGANGGVLRADLADLHFFEPSDNHS